MPAQPKPKFRCSNKWGTNGGDPCPRANLPGNEGLVDADPFDPEPNCDKCGLKLVPVGKVGGGPGGQGFSWKLPAIIAGALGGLGLVGWLVVWMMGKPEIELVGTPAITFRKMQAGTSAAPISLKVTNKGTGRLDLLDVSASNPVFSVAVPVRSLKPQESATITVGFTPKSGGVEDGKLTILSNVQPPVPLEITLKGSAAEHLDPAWFWKELDSGSKLLAPAP